MQSEPQQSSQNTSTEQVTKRVENESSQHGFDNENGVSLQIAEPDCAPVQEEQDGLARSAQDEGKRLSLASKSPTRLQSRIEEYENISLTAGSADPLVNRTISPQNTLGADVSPITKVPNELLTHVLANLSPPDLAATSLVSRRFHDLVTTPYAWRSAFARYFPGPAAIRAHEEERDSDAIVPSERRAFTRLTAKASWRSEYVLRTRLLRSLARGRPVQASSGNLAGQSVNRSRVISPEITYSSELLGSINQLHATWQVGPNKRSVKFIHGADDLGTASVSDPSSGKVERWGFADPQLFLQFSDLFPGDSQYGLGPGEVIGAPNVMSLSQPYGMIYGHGFAGGSVYYRSSEEMRGRFLLSSSAASAPQLGVPGLSAVDQCITSVWIAKSHAIPGLTDGLIGMLSGSSKGVLTAYSIGSLGASNNRTARFTRGEMTARWMLSPGVPIIAIAVDNEHSLKRQAENRIWAVVLNALGEVFYITKFPRRARVQHDQADNDEFAAWMTGRTVYWNLAEPSRRIARPDPYNESSVDGSYSPRSSWNGMCLNPSQIEAETREIESFARRLPKDLQKLCSGWDMRRRFEVDFAGDDEHNAGESIVVLECGHEEGSTSAVTRYTRSRVRDRTEHSRLSTPPLTVASTSPTTSPSLFGSNRSSILSQPSPFSIDEPRAALQQELDGTATPRPIIEEWRRSILSFGGLKKVRITATALDCSVHAIHTRSEDPLFKFADVSATSSPSLGPWASPDEAGDVDVPGQRARFIAVGTGIGSVLIWNVRDRPAKSADFANTIEPVRIIFTDSPRISSLALSSLCLVHGGSDGLVQAWDLLASDLSPVRTLNSRFSSRARRQLIQAQASPHGVGTNMYAAGAICLDPDPTVLRGVVSLGNRLRYWSYSSSAADQYKSSKRRLRRSERGSNQVGDRFSGATRTNLKDYIASERFELEREKQQRRKEADHIAGRFGTELLDGSEEEMLAYASMLSQETLAQEHLRRSSDTVSASDSTAFGSSESVGMWSSNSTTTPAVGSPVTRTVNAKTEEELDADLEEAIRQSLQSSPSAPSYDIAFRPSKIRAKKTSSNKASPASSPPLTTSSNAIADNDLDFAIQLSLAEEASKHEHAQADEVHSVEAGKGKQRQS